MKYVNTIKELYQREPDNEMAFGTLCNMYNELNMNAELKALIDDKLAKDPNNHTAWALKGQSLMNQNTTLIIPTGTSVSRLSRRLSRSTAPTL